MLVEMLGVYRKPALNAATAHVDSVAAEMAAGFGSVPGPSLARAAIGGAGCIEAVVPA
jgi:hypothetical protein